MYYIANDRSEENDRIENIVKEKTIERIKNKKGIPPQLTRESFESYMNTYKPWLNPQLKITDLVELFGTNRTKLSNFVNTTYGVNFNRYINQLRLKEVNRLAKLSSNAKKKQSQLATEVGFNNQRSFYRTLIIEQHTDKNDKSLQLK